MQSVPRIPLSRELGLNGDDEEDDEELSDVDIRLSRKLLCIAGLEFSSGLTIPTELVRDAYASRSDESASGSEEETRQNSRRDAQYRYDSEDEEMWSGEEDDNDRPYSTRRKRRGSTAERNSPPAVSHSYQTRNSMASREPVQTVKRSFFSGPGRAAGVPPVWNHMVTGPDIDGEGDDAMSVQGLGDAIMRTSGLNPGATRYWGGHSPMSLA